MNPVSEEAEFVIPGVMLMFEMLGVWPRAMMVVLLQLWRGCRGCLEGNDALKHKCHIL
jgi:hypothetical protein